jgi:hypothetical protein
MGNQLGIVKQEPATAAVIFLRHDVERATANSRAMLHPNTKRGSWPPPPMALARGCHGVCPGVVHMVVGPPAEQTPRQPHLFSTTPRGIVRPQWNSQVLTTASAPCRFGQTHPSAITPHEFRSLRSVPVRSTSGDHTRFRSPPLRLLPHSFGAIAGTNDAAVTRFVIMSFVWLGLLGQTNRAPADLPSHRNTRSILSLQSIDMLGGSHENKLRLPRAKQELIAVRIRST